MGHGVIEHLAIPGPIRRGGRDLGHPKVDTKEAVRALVARSGRQLAHFRRNARGSFAMPAQGQERKQGKKNQQ